MTQQEVVSNAIEQLEKEKQETEIKKIKGIVEAYLNKIFAKKETIKEAQKELKELEADLDDLKAGRLDKIEERQDKDPEHNKITLICVKKIAEEYIPYQPWRSPFNIEFKSYPAGYIYTTTTDCNYTTAGTNYLFDTMDSVTSMMNATGKMFQNFTGGSYDIGGHIVNL